MKKAFYSLLVLVICFAVNTALLAVSYTAPLLTEKILLNNNHAEMWKWLPPLLKNNFTIDMWIKPGSTQNSYANILDFNHRTHIGMVIQQNGDAVNNFCFALGNGTTSTGISYTLQANVWQHAAFVREGTTIRLYINGNLVGTAPCFAGEIYYLPDSRVTVMYNLNYGRYFNGSVAGLKIWDYARANANIIADSMVDSEFRFAGGPGNEVIMGTALASYLKGDFSIEFMIKPWGWQQTHADILDINHRANIGLVIQQNGDLLNNFCFGIGNGSTTSYINYTLDYGLWQLIKFERSGTNLNLYVNNSLAATAPCFSGDISFLPNSNATLGYNLNFGRYFNGYISDLRINFPAVSTPPLTTNDPGAIWFEDTTRTVSNGTTFAANLNANTGLFKIGICDIEILYNPNVLSVDTSVGTNGVTTDGSSYLSVQSNSGRLIIHGTQGYDTLGKGPGVVRVYTIHWKAIGAGTSKLECLTQYLLEIYSLAGIGIPHGFGSTVTVQ